MKKVMMLLIMLWLTFLLLNAEDFPIKESETIEKKLTPTSAKCNCLKVDNVFGSINIIGDNENTVRIKVQKTILARDKDKLQKAKAEVELKFIADENCIQALVDGPFRIGKDRICWNINKKGYVVRYDFKVNVPIKTALQVETVNDGDIDICGIEGENTENKVNNVNGKITINQLKGKFSVHTVNGAIVMKDISGSGKAHTINGKVSVLFNKNPSSSCSFKTVNGDLDINFLPGLSADFQLKTFSGKIYSDFFVTYRTRSPVKGKRKKGIYVYRSSSFQGVRIGNGGPTIKMDTLNGDILISKI